MHNLKKKVNLICENFTKIGFAFRDLLGLVPLYSGTDEVFCGAFD
jgi:hypothetical protein